ncbi:MAG: hypothetical protein WKF84_06930 [Pyrinomonadaceae bacterium]
MEQGNQSASRKLKDAANQLKRGQTSDQIRRNNENIEKGQFGAARGNERAVQQTLDQLTERLRGAERPDNAQGNGGAEEALDRTRQLADDLESLKRRMEESARRGESQGGRKPSRGESQQQGQQQQGQQQGQQQQGQQSGSKGQSEGQANAEQSQRGATQGQIKQATKTHKRAPVSAPQEAKASSFGANCASGFVMRKIYAAKWGARAAAVAALPEIWTAPFVNYRRLLLVK